MNYHRLYTIFYPYIALPDDNIALKKRYSKAEMRSMVLEVCQDWKTVEEIANYVGRTPGYMKNIVLPELYDVIEKMYDIPHRPRQKYRAKHEKTDKGGVLY